MGYVRLNLLIAAWLCLLLGWGFASTAFWMLGIVVGSGGVLLFLIAFLIPSEHKELSEAQVAAWLPDQTLLPEAGRVMYRVDTTLKGERKTSILCGKCASIAVVKGGRPSAYQCPQCKTHLWEETAEDE